MLNTSESSAASALHFYPMEADIRDYARPRLPLLVPPSWREWGGRRASPAVLSAFLGQGESYKGGRYALAEGMRRAGAEKGRSVLIPALHCRAIVEAVMFSGAEPRFYPVTADLRPDFSALPVLAAGSAPAAMVLVHYFGFPNAVDEAHEFCRSQGIPLVEDCAHALYGRAGDRLLGTIGDFAAASLWKFLPLRDGAVLLDHRSPGSAPPSESPSLIIEARGLRYLLESWFRWASRPGTLPALEPAVLAAEVNKRKVKHDIAEPAHGFVEFSPPSAHLAALRSSRWLAAAIDHERVILTRRSHYSAWLNGMRGVAAARPLYPELPPSVAPYAFPLLVDDPYCFHLIRQAGIPLWRWEDMAVTDCAVAADYRLRLLQLPCHQGLSTQALEWMIKTVRSVVCWRGR